MKLTDITKALEKELLMSEAIQRTMSRNDANQRGEQGAEEAFEFWRKSINEPLRMLLRLLLHDEKTRKCLKDILEPEAGR